MTISMYKASAPIFVQFLTSLSAVLEKAAAHAEAKKIDPGVLLNARLYPDMFPLVRQVRAPRWPSPAKKFPATILCRQSYQGR
jgi:uncharacterized protein